MCDGPIDRSLKYDWRNEEALRKIYPAANLDIRNEIGDMTMTWYADESNNIMTFNERENRPIPIQGSNVETLMHKVPRILNNAELAEECKSTAEKHAISWAETGWSSASCISYCRCIQTDFTKLMDREGGQVTFNDSYSENAKKS